jgi:sporulation-control protein spo0M
MKRRINLFSKRLLPTQIVNYFDLTQKYAIRAIFVLLAISVTIIVYAFSLQNNINSVRNNTLTYESYVSRNRALSEDLKKFTFKYQLLKNFQTGDANGNEYINTLINVFAKLNTPLILESFNIENTKATKFQVKFNTYENAITFVEALEEPIFQDVFESLELAGFNLSSTDQQEFTLEFEGVFN